MSTNFDRTFEKNKTEFKKKFNLEWNKEPQLYLTYIQSIYISSLHDIANTGFGQILAQQVETHRLIQHISKNLED